MLVLLKEQIRKKWNKPFTFIVNSVGMVLAFVVIVVMFSYAYSEFNHDQQVVDRDRIVRVDVTPDWGLAPGFLGSWLASEMVDVEQYCRIAMTEQTIQVPVQEGVKEMCLAENVIMSDTSFASMFSLRFLSGGVQQETDQVILSEQTAFKLFGKADPIGKTLILNREINLMVTGVFQDVTNPGLYKPKIIVPALNPKLWTFQASSLGETGLNFETYLRLKKNSDLGLVQAKFKTLYAEYLKECQTYEAEKIESLVKEAEMRNYTDVYFQPKSVEYCEHGNLNNVRVLTLIALLVLVVCIINYVNIATAKVTDQARNLRLKRILGSGRFSLIFSIVFEAVVVCCLSMLLAFFIVRSISVKLESWVGLTNLSDINWGMVLVLLLAVPVVCGILSGIFPAIYLSSLDKLKSDGRENFILRRIKSVLLISQFAVTFGLIISTLFVYKQMGYVKNLDPGYDRSNVVVVYGADYGSILWKKYPEYRNLLLQNPNILKVGVSREPIYNVGYMESPPSVVGWEKGNWVPVNHVDAYLLDLLDLEVVEGMQIDKEGMPALDGGKILMNQQMAKAIAALQPPQPPLAGERVSVLKDFHYKAMYEPIGPMYFKVYNQPFRGRVCVYIRINPGQQAQALDYIKTCFGQLLPDEMYHHNFMEDDYNRLYGADDLFADRLLVFSILSIVIACLGLLAFVAFFIEENVKNIGVRKVMGATEVQMMGLLNRTFLIRLLVGFMLCCPIVYFLLTDWLSRFAYKITLDWWIFIGVFVVMCCLVVVSISSLTWKAATANPVDSLKSE